MDEDGRLSNGQREEREKNIEDIKHQTILTGASAPPTLLSHTESNKLNHDAITR